MPHTATGSCGLKMVGLPATKSKIRPLRVGTLIPQQPLNIFLKMTAVVCSSRLAMGLR